MMEWSYELINLDRSHLKEVSAVADIILSFWRQHPKGM